MWDVMNVASYVYHKYNRIYHRKIDEMKLHKLLYFVQRESLVVCDEPVFDAQFYGWKYGPVLKEIREAYKTDDFPEAFNAESDAKLGCQFAYLFAADQTEDRTLSNYYNVSLKFQREESSER